MYCGKCGEQIPDESRFCPKCGGEIIIVTDTDECPEQVGINDSPKDKLPWFRKVPKIIWIGVVVVIVVVAAILIINGIGRASLKKALAKEWCDYEDSILKVLDIDEDEIEYRLETGYYWLDTTLAVYEWEPISGNQIKVRRTGNVYKTYTIKFLDDQNAFIISPALTSTDSSELWYR